MPEQLRCLKTCLTQQRQMLNDFMMQLQMQGMNPNQYLQMTGQSKERMMEQVRPQAIERIKARLVLEEVAKKEGFTAYGFHAS